MCKQLNGRWIPDRFRLAAKVFSDLFFSFPAQNDFPFWGCLLTNPNCFPSSLNVFLLFGRHKWVLFVCELQPARFASLFSFEFNWCWRIQEADAFWCQKNTGTSFQKGGGLSDCEYHPETALGNCRAILDDRESWWSSATEHDSFPFAWRFDLKTVCNFLA